VKVSLDHEVFDGLPRLSREIVKTITDQDTLTVWYDALIEKAAEISIFMKIMEEIGIDMEPAAGKVAFCKIAARWVEFRLRELGFPVPYPPNDPRTVEIERNGKRIAALKAQVRALGGDPDESLSKHFRKEAA
jgi:hypothetical protein